MAGEETKNTKKAIGNLRLLKLLRFFEEETDEQHPVTMKELIEVVEGWGMHAERHTVKKDVDLLVEEGYDLMEEVGSPKKYYMASRTFEDAELRLLIDAVSCARFISDKKREDITRKLQQLSSRHQAKKLERHIYAPALENSTVYYLVDDLNEAIVSGRKIRFQYYDYYLSKTENRLKTDAEGNPRWYTISPYALIWNNGYYYLAGGYRQKDGGAVKLLFRVDRMKAGNLEILEDAQDPRPADYQVEDYMNKGFRMFTGPTSTRVTLQCQTDVLKYISDNFGELEPKDYRKVSPDVFQVNVEVFESPTFYAWVAGFSGRIRILAPTRSKESYEAFLEETLKRQRTME